MRIPFSSRNGRDGDLRDGVWGVDWVWLILQWLHGAWCINMVGLFFFLYDSISTSMAFLRVAFYLACFSGLKVCWRWCWVGHGWMGFISR